MLFLAHTQCMLPMPFSPQVISRMRLALRLQLLRSFVVALVNSGHRGHFLVALVSLGCHDPGCHDLAMPAAKRNSGRYPAGKRDRRGERKRQEEKIVQKTKASMQLEMQVATTTTRIPTVAMSAISTPNLASLRESHRRHHRITKYQQ